MTRKIFLAILVCLSLTCKAQVMETKSGVDTLSIWQRLSLHTNVVDWAMTVPNIGAEFDIRSVNWNRWSVGFDIRWRPKTNHSIVKPLVFNLFEVMVEGREYWRERQAQPEGYLRPHRYLWQKVLSCRNMLPSHPKWIFYRGGWVSYGQYSLMLGYGNGWQGNIAMAGVTWGFIKPLWAFQNGTSVDMEVGVRAGVGMTSYSRYTFNQNSNCYPELYKVDNKIVPVLRDVHVSLVYRIGNYPIQKKYRWRYDVDLAFQNKKDSIYFAHETRALNNFINDSAYNVVAADFKFIYDSLIMESHARELQERRNSAPERTDTLSRSAKLSIKAKEKAYYDSLNINIKKLEAEHALVVAQEKKKAASESKLAKQRDKLRQEKSKALQDSLDVLDKEAKEARKAQFNKLADDQALAVAAQKQKAKEIEKQMKAKEAEDKKSLKALMAEQKKAQKAQDDSLKADLKRKAAEVKRISKEQDENEKEAEKLRLQTEAVKANAKAKAKADAEKAEERKAKNKKKSKKELAAEAEAKAAQEKADAEAAAKKAEEEKAAAEAAAMEAEEKAAAEAAAAKAAEEKAAAEAAAKAAEEKAAAEAAAAKTTATKSKSTTTRRRGGRR